MLCLLLLSTTFMHSVAQTEPPSMSSVAETEPPSLHSTDETEPLSMHSATETEPPTVDSTDQFDSFFDNCSTGNFDLTPDEYEIFPNGSAYVSVYRMTYAPDSYYLHHNGILAVCPPDPKFSWIEYDDPVNGTSSDLGASQSLSYITQVGAGISMVCLVLHLVVFAVVKDMRNLPGYNLASLCLSLLLSYTSIAVSRSDLADNVAICVVIALLTQFFFLASFLWMFVISVDVFRAIILATGSLRATSKGFKIKKYLFNSCVSWGTPLVFVLAAFLADTLEGTPEDYKPNFQKRCWFEHKHTLLVFFAGPSFAIISINFLLFGASACTVYLNRMRAGEGCSRVKDNHAMYFRLGVIMGTTWVSGVVAVMVHQMWVWCIFALLNTLQGFFILLAFTCTAKVRKFFKMKLFGGRRPSEQTLTPTFQSYCFYANSLDKDLDKVGGGKEKSGSIDTIVIHI